MVAGDHLRHERPDLRFGVVNWWSLTPEIAAARRWPTARTSTPTGPRPR